MKKPFMETKKVNAHFDFRRNILTFNTNLLNEINKFLNRIFKKILPNYFLSLI